MQFIFKISNANLHGVRKYCPIYNHLMIPFVKSGIIVMLLDTFIANDDTNGI